MKAISTVLLAGTVSVGLAIAAMATAGEVNVNIHNFVRAESDVAIAKVHDSAGFGVLQHVREPTPLDRQDVIRMNRDTLYSFAVLDLPSPATVTLPDAGGRYQSLQVINQDHYMFAFSKPGTYELRQENVGTRYGYIIIRTFLDAGDPQDVAAANAVQDRVVLTGVTGTALDIPDWNTDQLAIARSALNELGKLGMDASRAFGRKGEVDPVDYLVAAAGGWGGLPAKNAFYEVRPPVLSDGTPLSVTVKDVPVRAFWSLTVYNSDGFIEPNDLGVYSYNNVTATANADGSYTINFGGCEDGRINCIPITDGWNYAARMYEPGPEILSGEWVFPTPEPVK